MKGAPLSFTLAVVTQSMTATIAELIATAKKSPAYLEQERRLVRLQEGFSAGLAVVWLMASRSWDQVENSLSFAFTHDAFQTIAAVTFMASQGSYSPAKRELRYLLESVTKHAYVDLTCPSTALADRVSYLETKVSRSSIDFVKDVPLYGLSPNDEADFRNSVTSQYSHFSSYVHRSPTQIRDELRRVGKGVPEPKLIAADLERFNRECFAVYDLAMFLQMQVLGPGLSGDAFVHGLDGARHWPFTKESSFVAYRRSSTTNMNEKNATTANLSIHLPARKAAQAGYFER